MTDTKDKMSKPIILSYALLAGAVLSAMTAIFLPESSMDQYNQMLWLLAAALLALSLVTALATTIKTCSTEGSATTRTHALVLAVMTSFLTFGNLGFLGSTTFVRNLMCSLDMYGLGTCLHVYSNDYDGRFPSIDNWCDLLVTETDVSPDVFCTSPDAVFGESSLAMNKYLAETPAAQIPSEMVVLFETDKGRTGQRDFPVAQRQFGNQLPHDSRDTLVYEHRFNQSGGLEAVAWNNSNSPGCHVLFADGYAKWVPLDEIPDLTWTFDGRPTVPEDMAAAIAHLHKPGRKYVPPAIAAAILVALAIFTLLLARKPDALRHRNLTIVITLLSAIIGGILGTWAWGLYQPASFGSPFWGIAAGSLIGIFAGVSYTSTLSARSVSIPAANLSAYAASLGTLTGIACSSLVHLTLMILAVTTKPYALAFALPLGLVPGAILGGISAAVVGRKQTRR